MIRVGKITTTHGHKGALKVFSLTDDPGRFEELEQVYVANGDRKEVITITSIKYQKNNLIMEFKEIKDMDQAETYKGKYLFIDKSQLKKLPQDRFYIFDLVGLSVYENDVFLGELSEVIQTGSNDVYVVSRGDGQKDLLIPALKKVVKHVDLDQKKMDVQLLEGTLDNE